MKKVIIFLTSVCLFCSLAVSTKVVKANSNDYFKGQTLTIYNVEDYISQGEEGYVELGTFKFVAADYIGRLAVRFTASGGGVLNLSNIKYELVDDSAYPNMLK